MHAVDIFCSPKMEKYIMGRLKGRRILMFVEDIYEDLELWYPKLRLMEEEAEIVVAGPETGRVYHGKHGYPCEADASLEEAQFEKFDLVARKLGLRPGMRLLDVGCGWGGMVLHAVERYGVTALGVTLSRRQAEWAQKTIAEAGLADRAEVRHLDYREVDEGEFDAISSIGLTEHIGKRNLGDYFRLLQSKLRPGGRLLNHAIMRPTNTEAAFKRRGFINRYVFPDGELEALGHIVSVMQDTGFEVRHSENLREHYALTLAAWSANLDAHWAEAVEEVGEKRARVWRLYMAGSRLGFEDNIIQLHQVLGVQPDAGRAGMPLRPDWEVSESQRSTSGAAASTASTSRA
jgi:cyclopropane-fatty-acyl-phospholipid synthase